MATTRISTLPPPHIDMTKAELAFDERALPKLNRELKGEELLKTQQALRSLCDMLRDPLNVMPAISNGIVSSCRDLVQHSEITVRQLTTSLLLNFASHAVGRQAMLQEGLIALVAQRFDDEDIYVRQDAHAIMSRVTLITEGQIAVHEQKMVPVLINKLDVERDNATILVGILETLHNVIKHSSQSCLAHDAMKKFTSLSQHENIDVVRSAVRAMAALSFAAEGKKQAVSCGAVQAASALLQHADAAVRRHAASALMSICITTEGKMEALKCNATQGLTPLISDPDVGVRLAGIKAVTVVAEAAQGRQAFQALLPTLEAVAKTVGGPVDETAVARAAEIAIKTITWTP